MVLPRFCPSAFPLGTLPSLPSSSQMTAFLIALGSGCLTRLFLCKHWAHLHQNCAPGEVRAQCGLNSLFLWLKPDQWGKKSPFLFICFQFLPHCSAFFIVFHSHVDSSVWAGAGGDGCSGGVCVCSIICSSRSWRPFSFWFQTMSSSLMNNSAK